MATTRRPPSWLLVVGAVLAVAVMVEQARHRTSPRPTVRESDRREISPDNRPTVVDEGPSGSANRQMPRNQDGAEPAEAGRIADVTLRDRDGRIVYRGAIDVRATLERIGQGRRLGFPQDGSTFQNRERRLPRKPPGYYREYVHPTPGLDGPGPQRLVVGADGETYYTPDHYKSFRRIR